MKNINILLISLSLLIPLSLVYTDELSDNYYGTIDKVNIYDVKYEIPVGAIIQRPIEIYDLSKNIKGIITVKVKLKQDMAKHIGIYIGNGEVIHFNGEGVRNKSKATIREDSLKGFLDKSDNKLSIRKYPKNEQHAKAIVDEAKKIYNSKNNKKYNLVFNNCEVFAKHCYEVKYLKDGVETKEVYGNTQVDSVEDYVEDKIKDDDFKDYYKALRLIFDIIKDKDKYDNKKK